MIRAVLDTNVVVSAHLNPEGNEAVILELALAGRFRFYVSSELLEEYEGVLRRERFGLDARDIAQSVRLLRRHAERVPPRRKLHVTRDPRDNMILECALEARADYVVTGNLRHFPARFQDIRVIAPRSFLTILAAELG